MPRPSRPARGSQSWDNYVEAVFDDVYANGDIVAKTADETVSASTTLQDDDHLQFSIGSSATEAWFVEIFLLYVAANITMDLKVALAGPAGATGFVGIMGSAGVNVPGWGVQPTSGTPVTLTTALTGTISSGTAAAAVQGQALGGWVFGGGTSGLVKVQWAQNTSDAGALTIKRGSFLRLTKLAA